MDAVPLHPWRTRSLWCAVSITLLAFTFAQTDSPIGLNDLSNRFIAKSLVEQVVCCTRLAKSVSLHTRHRVITSCRDIPQYHAVSRFLD